MTEVSKYGGFIVSNNVICGHPILYTYRERSNIPQLNGWTILSSIDDNEYASNPRNFTILDIDSILQLSPVLLEIFGAPYGTDLCWLYKEGVHIGFYSLKDNVEVSIDDLI